MLGAGLRPLAPAAAIAVLFATAAPAPAPAAGVENWGENAQGSVGDGTTVARSVPTAVQGVGTATAITAGETGSAVTAGAVTTWGTNVFGKLGDGSFPGPETCALGSCSVTPVSVSGLSEVTAVSDGAALLASGKVMDWGGNTFGQLGDGTMTGPETCKERPAETAHPCSDKPVEVSGISEASAIATGTGFRLALLSGGRVMAWGNDGVGQLGNGKTTSSDTPVEVSGLTGVTAIAAGGESGYALLSSGKIMSWGGNIHGQLGNGTKFENDVPVEVTGITTATAIAAGSVHALALLSTGKVMAWGDNEYRQLGNSNVSLLESKVPMEVTGVSGVTAIAAGEHHNLALLTGGTLLGWGSNSAGQLGVGSIEEPESPRGLGPSGVCALHEVSAISAGSNDSGAYSPATEAFPGVTSVHPAFGALGGGTTVRITGENLGSATAVKFGTNSATSFKVNSETSIEAQAPAAEGTADVTVISPAGSSATCHGDQFTEVGAPTVNLLLPKTGSVTGGESVFIHGANFDEVSTVKFGSSSVEFTVVKNVAQPYIVAITPAGALGKVNVTVTAAGGTSAVNSKSKFTFTPTITELSPNTGPAAGGTPVTVRGTGFAVGAGATKFQFGTAQASSVNCSSSTECTLTTPPGKVGYASVYATAGRVKSSKTLTARFKYT